jgi:hypothetical protein
MTEPRKKGCGFESGSGGVKIFAVVITPREKRKGMRKRGGGNFDGYNLFVIICI